MAPIKFEENIKHKLEERKLPPSSNSWSQLNERLDADENKSRKGIYWWLSIAAGLLIMMAITVQFFNSEESETVMPQMVKENNLEELLDENQRESKGNIAIELAVEIDSVNNTLESSETPSSLKNESELVSTKNQIRRKADKSIQLASQNELNKNKNSIIQNNNSNKQVIIIDTASVKEAMVIANQDSKNKEIGVTNREIDSLLKVAQKELLKEKLNTETTRTVDVNSLLESVEDEMGQSYRGRVFKALEESYKTIKTAVVNRNN
ncbi:MAG: hypothetical protein AB8B52_06210 [Winogradskyella sp.]|uniref:hypothetical protein n=1 Tax=Winogradskyella sp. TaxID=1883156 RepID=UPI00385F7F49